MPTLLCIFGSCGLFEVHVVRHTTIAKRSLYINRGLYKFPFMELLLKCFMIAGIKEQIPNVYDFTAYGIYRLDGSIKIALYMELHPYTLCL